MGSRQIPQTVQCASLLRAPSISVGSRFQRPQPIEIGVVIAGLRFPPCASPPPPNLLEDTPSLEEAYIVASTTNTAAVPLLPPPPCHRCPICLSHWSHRDPHPIHGEETLPPAEECTTASTTLLCHPRLLLLTTAEILKGGHNENTPRNYFHRCCHRCPRLMSWHSPRRCRRCCRDRPEEPKIRSCRWNRTPPPPRDKIVSNTS